jgi:hypothetical protein
MQRRWAEAFARADADALASLYTADALFFGSMPDLYLQRSGVRRYFETLPKGYEGAAFGETQAIEIGRDLIVSAGFVTFTGEREGAPLLPALPHELDAGAERGGLANREPPRLAQEPGLTAARRKADIIPTRWRRDVRGVTATARHEK